MTVFLWWEKKGNLLWYDEISGSYFGQEREYNPKVGRFLAQDVIGGNIVHPKTWNRYGYCWGNPLILVDLDGRFPSWEEVGKASAWAKDTMTEVIEDANRVVADAREVVVKGIADAKEAAVKGVADMKKEPLHFMKKIKGQSAQEKRLFSR